MRRAFTSNFIRFLNKALAFVFCILLAASLSACGKKTEKGPITSASTEDEAAPINGGSMTIVMPTDSTLKPLEANRRELMDLFSLVYDSPLQYDGQLKLASCVVERWQLGEDGLTWTFYVRKNVKFHNGQTLKAGDIVYDINQLKAIAADTTKKSYYTTNMRYIASCAVVDDNTFTVTATEKTAKVLNAMVFPIIPDGSKDQTLPSGCGPYVVKSNENGKVLQLTANTGWWKRTPYIANITVKGIQDPDTALTSMDVSLVDLVHTDSLTASGYKQPNVTNVYEVMTQEYECILPNLRKALLADQKMRQAIIAGLDRKSIITETYLWHAVTTDVPVPPDVYYYDTSNAQHEYNTGTAATLLSQLGYQDSDGDGMLEKNGTPLTLTIIVNENAVTSARADAAKLAAQQLKKIGIAATVSVLNWTQYQAALSSGNFDLAFAGFSIPLDGDLSFLVRSNGAYNYGGYSSATMDQYLDAMRAATTESEITAAASNVQKLWTAELPIISLYFRTNSVVSAYKIKGISTMRDVDVFREIDQWYIYQKGDEHKADTPTEQ